MSRVGKMPVIVPSGVGVDIKGSLVTVKGSKGELTRGFTDRVSFVLEDDAVKVSRPNDTRESKALHGLSRSLLANMVEGVSQGFKKELEIKGVGYRAILKGKNMELQVGFQPHRHRRGARRHHLRSAGADTDHRVGHRQGESGTGGCRHSQSPSPRALQRQGDSLCRRACPAQGREGR